MSAHGFMCVCFVEQTQGTDDARLSVASHVHDLAPLASEGTLDPRLESVTNSHAPRTSYLIRCELEDSDPLVWRELEIRSDTTLDVLHWVLQEAFAWEDRHLHRFSLGGPPFDGEQQMVPLPLRSAGR